MKLHNSENVLFLDVDGVLNITGEYFNRNFDKSCLAQLQRIIKETGAEIVIVSQWRLNLKDMEYLKSVFESLGIPMDVRRKTVCHSLLERGREVNDYLKYPVMPGSSYAIIDDEPGYYGHYDEYIHDHLVVTNKKEGLTAEVADKAIFIIKKGKKSI